MKIDIHAHVLPGVDHGASDWDTSLKMLAKSARCGVKKVIATPHYLPWKDGVTPETICKLCKEAETRLQNEYAISMEIYPGHEVYYSVELVDILKEERALTLAGSPYVLVEFQQEESYQTICKAIRDLRYYGYFPIIAHAERYRCLHDERKIMELKEIGALLQVNVGAIQGRFFDMQSRRVKRWLTKELIDFLASDMHDMEQRPPMSKDSLQWVRKKLNSQYQEEILYGNAQKILAYKNA